MTNYIVTDTELTTTANKIREKLENTDNIEWENETGFANAINGIDLGVDFTITRMYIDTPPIKTTYILPDDTFFDPTGMIVMIDYTCGDIT